MEVKKILFVFSVIFFSLSFGQRKNIDAKIITNENDTLHVKIQVMYNMFDSTMIYGSSINSKVTIVGEDNKKTKIEASDIKELSFIDYDGKKRVFLNQSEDHKTLQERLYDGNTIEWFRGYVSGGMRGGENSYDFLINKISKKGIEVGYFTGLPKKKLKHFFEDEPEIFNFIDEMKSSSLRKAENSIDVCMESIIKKYESLKSKNNN